MDIQHRQVRQAIDIAVSKALEDIKGKGNARRSIRNLIDLGLLFSKNDDFKRFFSAAQEVIANPRNSYIPLVKRLVSDINSDTVKTVGGNLGYNSLIYGANQLKKSQEGLGIPIPWMLIFDISESTPAFFDRLKRFIKESREVGIYSYIVCPHMQEDIPVLCEIAKRFDECVFIFKVSAALITEQTAKLLGKTHNAMVSVQTADKGLSHEGTINAFGLLKEHRCLYGFHVYYNEENMNQVAAPEYIRSAIGFGSLFGVYVAKDSVSDACRNAVYAFVYQERGGNGQPLIALEWSRDMRYISGKLLSGDGYAAIDLAEKSYRELKIKSALPNPLLEILRRIKPCPSS